MNTLEIINETCVLMVSSSLILFAKGYLDENTQFNVGFFVVFVIFADMIINIAVALHHVVGKLRRWILSCAVFNHSHSVIIESQDC